MRSFRSASEPDYDRSEQRDETEWPEPVAADDEDDRGYFVIPVSVLERWRAATAVRLN